MSYSYFMASSRELQTGSYALSPAAVYPSFAAFMESEDYRLNERVRRAVELLRPDSGKPCDLRKAVGQVQVFQRLRDSRCVDIYPFPDGSERTPEEESIAAWFTLPYLYQTDEFAADLLCKYLRPDDRLEFLSVFLGHDEPLRQPVAGVIDLQDFAVGKLSLWDATNIVSTPPDNNLTRVLPPRAPQTHFEIRFTDFSKIICTVFLDSAEVYWNRKQLRLQGLF